MRTLRPLLALFGLALAACHHPAETEAKNGRIDQARLLAAENDPDNWLAYGRTYAEQRFSPLTDVNDTNVGQLGLAFSVPLDTNRGQEATPIVVDGVMYFSTAWSKVMAVKADTGEVLWKYDPKNIGAKGAHACCDVVNRGVAVWQGKVYVGTRKFLTVLAVGPTLKHLADIKLVTPVWAVPSAANGVLYVSSQKNLWAVQDENEMPLAAGVGK